MSTQKWNVTFQIYRKKGREAPHIDSFKLEVNPDEYVLDGIERIWAFHDQSLVFRHACHHSTCGACGMRVNGVEKLTCITPIREVVSDGGVIRVEPLRNFPVVSDLVVDMSLFYTRLEMAGQRAVLPVEEAGAIGKTGPAAETDHDGCLRLSDCIECGLCISACPVATTDPDYLGPAVLAAAQQSKLNRQQLMQLVDNDQGVWRCHSVFECTAVCPSFVEPAWRIMELRKQVVGNRFRSLFGLGKANPNVKEAKV